MDHDEMTRILTLLQPLPSIMHGKSLTKIILKAISDLSWLIIL